MLPSFAGNVTPEGQELVVSLGAADLDLHVQTITWELGADAPAGLILDAAASALRWTPTEAQGPGVYSFGIVAKDS